MPSRRLHTQSNSGRATEFHSPGEHGGHHGPRYSGIKTDWITIQNQGEAVPRVREVLEKHIKTLEMEPMFRTADGDFTSIQFQEIIREILGDVMVKVRAGSGKVVTKAELMGLIKSNPKMQEMITKFNRAHR